jgi:2-polyprenyl-6-methoxyphenol hydroxylase-like FAD-dependent oxidoreductase
MSDEDVDVVCTGSGVAGLASAISAVDLGGEVYVADSCGDHASENMGPVRSRGDRLHPLARRRRRRLGDQRLFRGAVSDIGPLSQSLGTRRPPAVR